MLAEQSFPNLVRMQTFTKQPYHVLCRCTPVISNQMCLDRVHTVCRLADLLASVMSTSDYVFGSDLTSAKSYRLLADNLQL
jgi:hypothetical protein